MKRRNFIFCTALSVGSISSAFASANKNIPFVENNLQQYFSAIGAQGELKFFSDNDLEKGFLTRSSSYLSSGYKPYGLKYYFCSGRSVAICPLVLSTESSGIIDLAILFFSKDNYGKWEYCNAFSGFHLESIAKALPELDQNYSTEQRANLLVPIRTLPEKMIPHTIFTNAGSLTLIVKIEDQKTTIDFSLIEKNGAVFAENGFSKHALSYNSLA